MITTLTTALALSSSLALTEPTLQEDIESTLAGMAKTALAADMDEYLEHVWTGEPTLAQEQWAWAIDLERIPPTVLNYEIIDGLDVVDDEVHADVRITWNSENWTGGDRVIDVPMRFVEEDGDWLYAGRQWTEIQGDGVRVLYADGLGESAVRALDVWPGIKSKVENGFNRTLEEPQVIKMYTSMPELQFSIFQSYVEPLGGWNEPMESIKLVGKSFSEGHLKGVLGHEYAHALTFSIAPPDVAVEMAHAVPWWVHEGIAELATQNFVPNRGRTQVAVEHWHKNGSLQQWEDLTDFYTVDTSHYSHVYVQGRHMVSYINENFGQDARIDWIENMMQGVTLEEASEQSLGKAWSEIDSEWRDAVETDVKEREAKKAEKEAAEAAKEKNKSHDKGN
jgi:hypothetical protein